MESHAFLVTLQSSYTIVFFRSWKRLKKCHKFTRSSQTKISCRGTLQLSHIISRRKKINTCCSITTHLTHSWHWLERTISCLLMKVMKFWRNKLQTSSLTSSKINFLQMATASAFYLLAQVMQTLSTIPSETSCTIWTLRKPSYTCRKKTITLVALRRSYLSTLVSL